MDDTIEVMRFLMIQTECMHVKLEKMFSNPDDYDSRVHVPCVTMCPYCKGDSAIPSIIKEKLVDCLDNAFANGATSTKDTINAIYGAREHIWSHVRRAQK